MEFKKNQTVQLIELDKTCFFLFGSSIALACQPRPKFEDYNAIVIRHLEQRLELGSSTVECCLLWRLTEMNNCSITLACQPQPSSVLIKALVRKCIR